MRLNYSQQPGDSSFGRDNEKYFFIVMELGDCVPEDSDKRQWWGNY